MRFVRDFYALPVHVSKAVADNGLSGTGCVYKDAGRNENLYKIKITYIWADKPSTEYAITGELLAGSPS